MVSALAHRFEDAFHQGNKIPLNFNAALAVAIPELNVRIAEQFPERSTIAYSEAGYGWFVGTGDFFAVPQDNAKGWPADLFQQPGQRHSLDGK